MPETVFDVLWPDGEPARCYSPSTVVHEHFEAGRAYATADFLARARQALNIASERVRQKFGYYCSGAMDQLASLERDCGRFGPHRVVRVLAIHPKASAPPLSELHAAEVARSEAHRASHPLLGHYPVIIVGGGQAGLAVSYYLRARGVQHLVLDRAGLAHAWRNERWDSFCLVTPNWQCRLPGFPYRGDDPDGFMLKDEIVEYVEGFAHSFEPPLHEGVEVLSVQEGQGGGYALRVRRVAEPDVEIPLTADQVVLASGAYAAPRVPDYAAAIPDAITQLHSSNYRGPAQLPDGAVLVAGSGQSGCQIAEDLHLAGREVVLAGGNAPRAPRRYRGRDAVAWLEDMGHYDVPITEQADPDATRRKTNHYLTGRDGGRDIDLRKLATEGMRLCGRLEHIDAQGVALFKDDLVKQLDAADASYLRIRANIDAYITAQRIDAPTEPAYEPCWRPDAPCTQLDLPAEGVRSIVWCIGFRQGFDYVDVDVFDERGAPEQVRGVTRAPGLYFIGLPWLHTWGSGRMSHLDRDARYIADEIAHLLESRAATGERRGAVR